MMRWLIWFMSFCLSSILSHMSSSMLLCSWEEEGMSEVMFSWLHSITALLEAAHFYTVDLLNEVNQLPYLTCSGWFMAHGHCSNDSPSAFVAASGSSAGSYTTLKFTLYSCKSSDGGAAIWDFSLLCLQLHNVYTVYTLILKFYFINIFTFFKQIN